MGQRDSVGNLGGKLVLWEMRGPDLLLYCSLFVVAPRDLDVGRLRFHAEKNVNRENPELQC